MRLGKQKMVWLVAVMVAVLGAVAPAWAQEAAYGTAATEIAERIVLSMRQEKGDLASPHPSGNDIRRSWPTTGGETLKCQP